MLRTFCTKHKKSVRMGESRGSIAFFMSDIPPVPLDISCCPVPASSRQDDLLLMDGPSYNYNVQPVPPEAPKTIAKRLEVAPEAMIEADVDSGRLTGLVFVSERQHNLETPQQPCALLMMAASRPSPWRTSMALNCSVVPVWRTAAALLVATRWMVKRLTITRWSPCKNVVYTTNLRTGETKHLTPPGTFDISLSVSHLGRW